MALTKSKAVKIGQTVEYVSTRGLSKVGLVVATADSLREGTSFSESYPLSADQVNLIVFSATGSHGPRLQVPSEASVKDNQDFAEGGFYRVLA